MFTSNKELMEELHALKAINIDIACKLVEIRTLVRGNRGYLINAESKAAPKRKKPRERLRTTGGKKITETEIAEFIRLFDQGLSFVEISGQTGRSASSIGNYVYEAKKGINND